MYNFDTHDNKASAAIRKMTMRIYPAENQQSARAIIEFTTGAVAWTAIEVSNFTEAVSSLYWTYVYARFSDMRDARQREFLDQMARRGEDLLGSWGFMPYSSGDFPSQSLLARAYISQIRAWFTNSALEFSLLDLGVHSIHIASAGIFSLEGLGDAVREVRELIKDIAWRNRQERERGELDIFTKRMELLERFGRWKGPGIIILDEMMLMQLRFLLEMEREGKLNLLVEE